MKKLVLAAAIAAVASNAMAVEVYKTDDASVKVFGEIRTKLQSTAKDGEGSKFDMGGSKLGVQASYGLGNGLTAGGYLRYSADLNESGSVKVSKGYLSLAHDNFGKVMVGKQGSVHDAMIGFDDSYSFGGKAKQASNAFGTDGIESAVVYTWSNDNFTVMAQHSMTAEDEYTLDANYDEEDVYTFDPKTGEKKLNKDQAVALKGKLDKTMAIGAKWESGFGLDLSGAYTIAKLDKLSVSDFKKGATAKTLGFQAGYSIKALTLKAAVVKVKETANNSVDKDDSLKIAKDSFGLGASYALGNGVSLYGTYDFIKADDKNAKDDIVKNKNLTFGADYKVHKNAKVFAEVGNAKVDYQAADKKDTSKNRWAIGARVYF